MRRFFKNNQGMTLIELLIAITILGLVAAPLLHGFLTSAQTEVKARKMGEITNVAQNVMEIVEGNEFEDIVVEQIDNTYRIFETTTNNNVNEQYYSLFNGNYRPAGNLNKRPEGEDFHIGLKNYQYAGKNYEIMVDIEASGYQKINHEDELSVHSEMDYKFNEVPETPVERKYLFYGDYILPARTITLNVTTKEEDGKVYATVKAEYSFDGRYVTHDLGSYTFEVKDEEEVPALYLFYHPSYAKRERYYILTPDNIKINNPDDVRFDLYLMKQRNARLSDADLKDLDDEYVCRVQQSMTTYNRSQERIGAKIYTNVEDNLGGANNRKPDATYVIDYIKNYQKEYVNATLYPFKTDTETRTRIYKVTVKVYEESSDFGDEALGTLTGAILK